MTNDFPLKPRHLGIMRVWISLKLPILAGFLWHYSSRGSWGRALLPGRGSSPGSNLVSVDTRGGNFLVIAEWE